MKKTMWLIVVLVLGGIAAIFYYWQMNQQREPLPPVETPPAPEAKVEPPIHHPIQEAQPSGAAATPLPPLNDSDAAMQDALAEFFGKKAVEEFFDVKDIVRRLVVTVDNLPRQKVPMRYRLFKPVVGQLRVTGEQEDLFLNPDNAERYKPFVWLTDAVDTKKLVAMYIHFYPLFQEEYQSLGYPKGYFNDRLIEAIDDMLATPDVPGRIKLIRPNVLYQFADPDLEALSAGRKILIRMGPENAARIKARLRKIREELTGQPPS
jgi:Protein of unknown function (DUF3014)